MWPSPQMARHSLENWQGAGMASLFSFPYSGGEEGEERAAYSCTWQPVEACFLRIHTVTTLNAQGSIPREGIEAWLLAISLLARPSSSLVACHNCSG